MITPLSKQQLILPSHSKNFHNSANYFKSPPNIVPATAAPVTMSCWMYFDELLDNDYFACGLLNSSSFSIKNQVVLLRYNNVLKFRIGGPLGSYTIDASPGISTFSWSHIAVTFDSNGDVKIYVDGKNSAYGNTSKVPVNINRFCIGYMDNTYSLAVPRYYWPGKLSDIACWDTVLSDEQIRDLGNGVRPNLIQRGKLVAYLPSCDFDIVRNVRYVQVGLPTSYDLPEKIKNNIGNSLFVRKTLLPLRAKFGVTKNIVGGIESLSSFVGDLTVHVKLLSSISSISTVGGLLKNFNINSGSIDGVSTLTGNIEVEKNLLSVIAGASSLGGNLNSGVQLDGMVSPTTSLVGSMRASTSVAAICEGQSSLSAKFSVKKQLYCSSDAVSNFGAILSTLDYPVLLGPIDGLSSFSATLIRDSNLISSIGGTSSFSGNIQSTTQLSSSIDAISELQASIITFIRFIRGEISSSSSLSANILSSQSLDGIFDSTSSLDGSLTLLELKLRGNIVGLSDIIGILYEPPTVSLNYVKKSSLNYISNKKVYNHYIGMLKRATQRIKP